jgi:hypothetical protein
MPERKNFNSNVAAGTAQALRAEASGELADCINGCPNTQCEPAYPDDCGTSAYCSGTTCVSCTGSAPTCPGSGEAATCQSGSWTCGPGSPIIVDVRNDGYNLTSAKDGVLFDLNGDGKLSKISWTRENDDDSWLSLDRNGNGKIDNGLELFGNFTKQPRSVNPNGFIALAEFDKLIGGGNANGQIDKGDRIFPKLQMWTDSNHNGVSEASELRSLDAAKIVSIDLNFKESKWRDIYGNQFRFKAKAEFADRRNKNDWVYDVFLVGLK